ncbi:MAG: EAL domain-containing protein [Pseudomonadota bacterium]
MSDDTTTPSSFTRLLDACRVESGRGQAVAPARGRATNARKRSEARLLLVDDRPELLKSLYELVRVHGFENVVQAPGGRAALDALEREEFDLVLLDLIMPEISGQDVLQYAQDKSLPCKIVVVSGDASFSGVKHALTCGAFDFVKKPYEAGELIATVENALRARDLEVRNANMSRQLFESEMLHRFIVNSSPDLVYMLDRNGCFMFLNDRVESLLGYEKDELLGRHYSEVVHEEHIEAAQHLMNERRTGSRAIHNAELRLKSKRADRSGRPFQHGTVWMELTAMGVYLDPNDRTRAGFIGTYGTARDISQRKEAEQVINFQAYHDLLTHLPNRALMKDRLSLAITHAQRNKRKLAVMFLDLDRFKLVNDTLGHSMGDRLLKAVANRLQSCLRSGDTLARFGGDEFTLLLPEVRTRDDVVVIASKILDRLSSPFVIDGHELFVGASIGCAMYPEAGDSVEALIQSADIAMYHIKSRGKNGYQFFSEEMNLRFSTRLSMERELRNALSGGELEVHYQPQVNVFSGDVTGLEALVRWDHPERGLVQPDDFLAVAEETGLITQIDEFVQDRAFADTAKWRAEGLGDISLSVNLTASQLEQDGFVERFEGALRASGLDPTKVKVEITESTLMRDLDLIVPRMRALRELGVGIAIDDFGTGYSSLSYLQQFPVTSLKIDRSFVGDIRAERSDASIVDAIVSMARGMRLGVIAEGVENRTQLRYLRAQGCSEVQGYIFSRALPAAELTPLLRKNSFRDVVSEPETQIAAV